MEKIRKKNEKLLCDLLEESGNIILNSKEECLEDRLECYQEIVEVIKKVDEKIGYIISETENYTCIDPTGKVKVYNSVFTAKVN